MRQRIAHILAIVGACIAWAALTLQLYLLIRSFHHDGKTTLDATWRFIGYFTILTNIAAAIAMTRTITRPQNTRGLGNPRIELAVATAIAMVGLVYVVVLRPLWNPQGLPKVADALLHYVTPVIFVMCFLFRGHTLRWHDAGWALIPPTTYVLYAFTRGARDGWYAYHFLDPTRLSPTNLALHMAGLLLAFWVAALLLITVSNLTTKRLSIQFQTNRSI